MTTLLFIHCVSKNVPPLVSYNLDMREHILIFFGRNITHQVSKTLYCAIPQIVCASALPGKVRKHENCIFSLKCCISALPEFNQSLLDLFSLFDSRLILTLLCDSLNLVINALSSGLFGDMVRGKEVESAAAVGLCCTHSACAPVRCLPERKKCHL